MRETIETHEEIGEHENIIRFYEAYEDEDRFYLVMEYVTKAVELETLIKQDYKS